MQIIQIVTGLIIYFSYGIWHSRGANPTPSPADNDDNRFINLVKTDINNQKIEKKMHSLISTSKEKLCIFHRYLDF